MLKQLELLSFGTYVPKCLPWSKRRDRRKCSRRPLFPSYLFLCCQMLPAECLDIIKACSVVRIVGVHHHSLPVPDHQLELVRRLLEVVPDAGFHPPVAGQKMTVMDGPLARVVGVVTGERRRKFVIEVELLARAVAALLEAEQLAPFRALTNPYPQLDFTDNQP